MSTQTIHTVTKFVSAPYPEALLPFIAEVTKSLAWPVVVLAVIAFFRPEMSKLLGKLAKFEGFGFKVDFEEAATRLLVASSGPNVEPEEDTQPSDDGSAVEARSEDNATIQRGSDGGRTVATDAAVLGTAEEKILASWARIETEIRRAAKNHGLPSSYKAVDLISELRDAGAISERTYALLNEARQLRNSVAHGRATDLTFLASQAYAHTAGNLIIWIRSESSNKLDEG